MLSMALSATGNFGREKEETIKAAKASLELALSSSETGATIARTQTINMLREMMYRTCERYLSGALGPAEFSIQAARDQRLMVSILAIEQLTGAVTIKPTIIASNGIASVGENSSDAILKLAEAQKKRDDTAAATKKADSNLAAAKKTMDEKEPGNPKCSEIKDGDTTAAARRKECAEAKEAVTIAETKQKSARDDQKTALDDYNTLAAQTGNGSVLLVATTAGQLLQGGGEISTAARSADVASVANVVRDIVKEAYAQDEFLLMCVRELPSGGTAASGTVQGICLDYIKESLKLQVAKKMEESSARVRAAMENNAAVSSRLSDKFWAKVEDTANIGMVDRGKLNALIASYDTSGASPTVRNGLANLSAKSTKSDIQAAFQTLPPFLQKWLAE